MRRETISFCGKKHFLYLKGLAIAAVVVSHIGNYSGKTWFTPLGGIGVAIFLLCSGYGLTKSYQKSGLSCFWRKKLIAVYLSFFVVELIASLALQRAFVDVLLDVSLVKIAHPYGWYIWYLLLCYVLFWIVFRVVRSNIVRLFILGAMSFASFFAFENLQAEQALSFFCGVLFASYDHLLFGDEGRQKGKRESCRTFSPQIRVLVIGMGLIFVAAVLLALKQVPLVRASHHYLVTLVNLTMKLSCAIGLACVTWQLHPFFRVFSFLGTVAYSVYLVHGYFICFVVNRVVAGYYIPSALVSVIISIAFSIVLHYGMEWIRKKASGVREKHHCDK